MWPSLPTSRERAGSSATARKARALPAYVLIGSATSAAAAGVTQKAPPAWIPRSYPATRVLVVTLTNHRSVPRAATNRNLPPLRRPAKPSHQFARRLPRPAIPHHRHVKPLRRSARRLLQPVMLRHQCVTHHLPPSPTLTKAPGRSCPMTTQKTPSQTITSTVAESKQHYRTACAPGRRPLPASASPLDAGLHTHRLLRAPLRPWWPSPCPPALSQCPRLRFPPHVLLLIARHPASLT